MTEYANEEPVAEINGHPVRAADLAEQYKGPAVVKLSHTTIETALSCPRKYRYRYVDQLEPVSTPAAFAFGRAVHAAIAAAYGRQKTPMTAEEVAGVFAQNFAAANRDGVSFKEGETFEDRVEKKKSRKKNAPDVEVLVPGLLSQGRTLVSLWYQRHRDEVLAATVIGCEVFLRHDIDVGLVLQGFADIIEERDGKLYVGDHKTAAGWGPSDEIAAAQSPQLTAYAYLCWKKYNRLPDGLYLTVLKKTKVPDVFRYYAPARTLDDVRAFEDYVRKIAGLIRFYEREHFDVMNVSRECSWCGFAPLCLGLDGAAAMFKTREKKRY